ncbi:hypothetical protein RRF57_011239 [Xylaria bambusicola]|uniref:Uncharacterized protein n=1 Tax=Xylaria bambusicola TaxID=326684 RepID=A0AAN7Z9Z3_9PEZI
MGDGIYPTVVLTGEIPVIWGGMILPTKVIIEIIGSPLGVFEGRDIPPVISMMNLYDVLCTAQSDAPTIGAFLGVAVWESTVWRKACGTLIYLRASLSEPFQHPTRSGVDSDECIFLVTSIYYRGI